MGTSPSGPPVNPFKNPNGNPVPTDYEQTSSPQPDGDSSEPSEPQPDDL